jgi:hypothetical protein
MLIQKYPLKKTLKGFHLILTVLSRDGNPGFPGAIGADGPQVSSFSCYNISNI